MVTLVVLSILASLSLTGLVVARTSAKRAKTIATIRKLSEILLPYYEEYETRRPDVTFSGKPSSNINVLAKQTAIRRLMALELPERKSDLLLLNNNGVPTFNPLKISLGGVDATLSDNPTCARRYSSLAAPKMDLSTGTTFRESAQLLHLIVTRGPVADPDIIAHFRGDEVKTPDSGGLAYFIDGWNNPIAFLRWPTGFQSPMQPIDGTPEGVDPLVSFGGHRLVPLIYSAGPNESYDVFIEPDANNKPVSYGPLSYDPFSSATNSQSGSLVRNPPSPQITGAVVLVPMPLTNATNNVPMFKAQRLPLSDLTNRFQTVGSEGDAGSPDNGAPNGILESRDNIHNHDMSR